MSDLDAFLAGNNPAEPVENAAPAVEAEPVTAPEPEAPKQDRQRDEQGRFAKGEKEEETPPVPKETKPEKAPETGLQAGISAERKKRQDAERRALELEQRLQALEAAKNAAPMPDPQADPQGYTQAIQQQQYGMVLNQNLNFSEMLARDKHGDDVVEEAQQAFLEAVKVDPTLYQQLHTQRNPYGWLMKWHKQRQFMSEVGDDPSAYRQKLEAEIRAQLEAELQQKRPQAPTPPPSLASVRSNGRVSEPVWSGPPPLNSIFGR